MALMSRVTRTTKHDTVNTTGRLEFVTINPGDFRVKYLELDGFKGACNRPIDPLRVNQYGKVLPGICTTVVVLLEENNQLFILDGQHRIAAISTYATRPMQIAARILTRPEIHEVSDDLAAYMRGLGTQKPQGTGARLAIFRSQSPWIEHLPARFEESFTFTYSKNRVNWVTLMTSIVAAERSFKRGRFVAFSGGNSSVEPVIFDLWLKASPETVRDVFNVLMPWVQMADEARAKRKITWLLGVDALTTWFVVSKTNAKKACMKGLPERLLDFDALAAVKQSRSADTALALVAAMNYKRKPENCVTMFGDNGRQA